MSTAVKEQILLRKSKNRVLIVAAALLLFTAGCGSEETNVLTEENLAAAEFSEKQGSGEELPGTGETGAAGEEEDPGNGRKETLVVHVCGQVLTPGVYELPAGSRIYEAIEAAGGLGQEAAPEGLNQAAKAMDGQQIYVPSASEVAEGTVSPAGVNGGSLQDAKVNINTAGEEELMTLTGIGEAKAAAIIRHREENGAFEAIEELMEISGIKEGVFEKIKEQITV